MLLKFRKLDWSIVLLLLAFMVIGTLLVYSATVDDPKRAHAGFAQKNLINYAIGFTAFFSVLLLDYRLLTRLWAYIYGFGIFLLLALYAWGQTRDGATGWFQTPLGDFQPAELMKLILILMIGTLMAKKKGERLRLIRDIVPIGLLVFVPFVLVVIQPDLGNGMIFLVILIGMLWIGNMKFTQVLVGVVISIAFTAGFFYMYEKHHDMVQSYAQAHHFGHWVARIDTFLNPDAVVRDKRLQYEHSRIAIGSGQLYGDGYLHGDSVHKGFVPVVYSDAIFVVVGEEFGFLGASALLLLYFLLIYRMILVSINTKDLAGSYIIVGIVSMYVFQIFQNIGMLIGLMPLTGITLPFVSYGGTSLLINMICMGLVLSVQLHQKKETMFGTEE